MSLAEIYMELPDGHRAKKDYEALIAEPRGKMVEMSMRLDELEETVRELKLKAPNLYQPHPAPQPRLIEVVDAYLGWIDSGIAYKTDYKLQGQYNDKMRLALAAERKLISDFKKKNGSCHTMEFTKCDVCEFIDALDGGGK